MTRPTAVILALLCLESIAAGRIVPGQTPGQRGQGPPPARDAQPPTGTSTIRGRVIASDTGRGIRGAVVRATTSDGAAARSVLTDAQGRFELATLPAGRYTLTASKQTFIALEHGQTRPFQSGKPLVVGANQSVERVDFSLPRGGVIAGRVLDELGEPLVGLTVRALRQTYAQGHRQLTPVGTGVPTNDIGEFRIFGLSPGSYFVSAVPRFSLASDAAVASFGPTYFPSVTSLAEARRVSIGLGQTVANVDLTMTPVKTATITGRAIDANGQPLTRGTLNVIHRAPAYREGLGAASLKPDGTFALANVPPGDYDLDLDTTGSSPGAAISATRRVIQRVVVDGADLTGVVLAMTRMSGITGRVVVPAGASLPPSSVRLSPYPADADEMRWFAGDAVVADDLTFDLAAPPGQMTIRATSLPRGWALKEIRLDGRTVTDRGVSLTPGEKARDVEIELTNMPPTVSGTVRNSKGEAVDDYAVLVFAQNAELRTGSPRYFAIARPDQTGSFSVSTLAPGDYYAVAVGYADPAEAADPDVLIRLEQDGVRFTIREGETRSLDLRLTDR